MLDFRVVLFILNYSQIIKQHTLKLKSEFQCVPCVGGPGVGGRNSARWGDGRVRCVGVSKTGPVTRVSPADHSFCMRFFDKLKLFVRVRSAS